MHDIDSACVAGINRKQELYGLKEDISKSDDDRILQEERELREGLDVFSESLRTFAMPGVDQKWSLRFRFYMLYFVNFLILSPKTLHLHRVDAVSP